MQIHPVHGPLGSSTSVVDADGVIRDGWLAVFVDHADRATLGSDLFLTGTDEDRPHLGYPRTFVDQLPDDLGRAVG